MKENSKVADTNVATIEKDIINAQHFIDSIKTDKEYKEENGWHGYYNKEIVELARILENILSDYQIALKENEHKTEKIENQKAELAILNEKQKDFNKLQNTLSSYKGQFRRQEKEIEELKGLIAHKNEYTKKLEEDLFENSNNYVIPVQKVKDKIEEEKLPLTIVGGRKNKKTLEYGIKLGRRQALQELIEEREEKE